VICIEQRFYSNREGVYETTRRFSLWLEVIMRYKAVSWVSRRRIHQIQLEKDGCKEKLLTEWIRLRRCERASRPI